MKIDKGKCDGSRVVLTSNHKNGKGLTGIIIKKNQFQAVVRKITVEFQGNFANLKHLDQ